MFCCKEGLPEEQPRSIDATGLSPGPRNRAPLVEKNLRQLLFDKFSELNCSLKILVVRQ